MLVLSRKPNQRLVIIPPGGPEIAIELIDSTVGWARLGVEAPREVKVLREEIRHRTEEPARE